MLSPTSRANAASFSVTSVSLKVMSVTFTSPVFVTTTVYVTSVPTSAFSLGSAVFVMLSSDSGVTLSTIRSTLLVSVATSPSLSFTVRTTSMKPSSS